MKMGKRNIYLIKIVTLLWAFLIGMAMIFGCGEEPLGPADNGWVRVGLFPITSGIVRVNSIATKGGPVWAVTSEDVYEEQRVKANIITYNDGYFGVEYESPPGYEYAGLADIAFDRLSDKGWAVGYKDEENELPRPLMVIYDPKLRKWREESVTGFNEMAFSRVMPITDNEVWVLVDNNYQWGDRDGLLAKYSQGKLAVYENLGPVTAIYPYAKYKPQTLYAVTYSEDGLPPGELPKVYISADIGGSWAEETIPRDLLQGRVISRAYAGAGYGPDFYILAECGHDAWAIIDRTGPPGDGEYSLVFLAHSGPYLSALNDIAFRNPTTPPRGISVDGVAVGRETSVLFDEGHVYLEKLPYALDFRRVVRYGGNGFFALAVNEAFGGWELLYHP